MNLYPAMKANLGTWTYYVVKMSARELSDNVRFASEIYEDRTLSEAIQRILKESRVRKEIVTYLKRQQDHFFSSIVIAALNGDPIFYPISITDDPRFQILIEDKRLNETFGVLKFDGSQKYYALDGQHRLAAIRTLLDRNDPISDGAPKDFPKEEFSVLLVVPKRNEANFMQKYRRLFANLNRYAKPMDQATNIIMDEDDAIAIITRKLISDHDFFKSAGRQRGSIRIKTDKGKNLNSSDTFFTSIEALYAINTILLSTPYRENYGWGSNNNGGEKFKEFIRFRPSEEYIDLLSKELNTYWDAIIDEIPVLKSVASKMRNHTLDDAEIERGDEFDHVLFWPIGQEMLASIVRQALDKKLRDPDKPEKNEVKRVIRGLGKLEWRLHLPPWRHFLLTRDIGEGAAWKMRNDQRKEAVRLGARIALWLIGVDSLSNQEVKEIKDEWASMFVPAQSPEEINRYWEEVKKIKSR